MIQQFLSMFGHLLKWYFICEPWDKALRVRLGRHIREFGPGLHFKIPYVDVLYCQNVRRRVMGIGNQTTTTRDGQIIAVGGSLGYRIQDVLTLHQTLHDADATVTLQVSGAVARYVAAHEAEECTPEKITKAVQRDVDGLDRYGLADVEFFLSSYVTSIPAIRLISDSLGGSCYGTGLSTNGGAGAPQSSPR